MAIIVSVVGLVAMMIWLVLSWMATSEGRHQEAAREAMARATSRSRRIQRLPGCRQDSDSPDNQVEDPLKPG